MTTCLKGVICLCDLLVFVVFTMEVNVGDSVEAVDQKRNKVKKDQQIKMFNANGRIARRNKFCNCFLYQGK